MKLSTFLRNGLIAAGIAGGFSAAATRDLGGGFADHGVSSPVCLAKGITAARSADGREVLTMQLADWRGCFGMATFDFATGKTVQVTAPLEPNNFRGVFSALYSARHNRLYSHHSSTFTEFDPAANRFTFVEKTPTPGMGMAMTEDGDTVWCVAYPDCRLYGFDILKRKLTDYGSLNQENWAQYQRTVAVDDAGWIYTGIGSTRAQIIAFHPATGQKVELLAAADRPANAMGQAFRATDGKVYGAIVGVGNPYNLPHAWKTAMKDDRARWYEMHQGKFRPIDGKPQVEPADIITGSQNFNNFRFPSGRKVLRCDSMSRELRYIDPVSGKTVEARLDIQSEGPHQMSVAATENGLIVGGTAFPMRNFVYDPAADRMIDRNGSVQWNALLTWKNHVFVGAYNGGFLLDWDLNRPWVGFAGKVWDAKDNPRCVPGAGKPEVIRPHVLKMTNDARYLLMGGTPQYGSTGGGLVIWDRETDKLEVQTHRGLLPDHSIYSMVMLPDGRIFMGSTIFAGTGGQIKARRAELFEYDFADRKIGWRKPLFDDVDTYYDLTLTPQGKILGAINRDRIFLFDPDKREVVAVRQLPEGSGRTVWQQSPRMFVRRGDEIYLLCENAIFRVNPLDCALTEVARPPMGVEVGGAILNDRLYFGSKARLYSYQLPPAKR